MSSESSKDQVLAALTDVKLELNGVQVLSDIGFQIRPGEVIGLVGANGAGKSSVANVLCGYYKPTSGTVELDGSDISKGQPAKIAKMGVRRSFQSVSYLSGISVYELVMLGAEVTWPVGLLNSYFQGRITRREEQKVRSDAMDLLERAGLSDFAYHRIEGCPYGVRKFADVARAFMTDSARLVILDEPTSGVGEAERERLVKMIDELRHSRSIGSLLIVDHDVGFIRKLCKRVIVLEEGRVLADGNCNDVLGDSRVIASFVGSKRGRS